MSNRGAFIPGRVRPAALKPSEKAALKHLFTKLGALKDGVVAIDETDADKAERLRRVKHDFDYFARYYFPHYANSPCASFHIEEANAILKNPRIFAVEEWARGHAKSIMMTVLVPAWLYYVHEQTKCLLLVGRTSDAAEILLGDLQFEIEHNERLAADFGSRFNPHEWGSGRFVTTDNCMFMALGLRQNARGTRKRGHRPDYIICDDLDDDKAVRNPKLVQEAVETLKSAIYGTMDMGRGRMIVVGNRIHERGILATIAAQPGVHHRRVNALQEDGTPSWPEKYTAEEIRANMAKMGRLAQREYMNDAELDGQTFREADIQWGQPPALSEFDAVATYIDPAYSASSTADHRAAVMVGRKGDKYWVLRAYVRKGPFTQLVKWCYNLDREMQSRGEACQWFMEVELKQGGLIETFRIEGNERGYQLPLKQDRRKKPNKQRRIEDVADLFHGGKVFFDERRRTDPDMEQLVRQFLTFDPNNKRQADDGPDAFESAVYIINRISRNFSFSAG